MNEATDAVFYTPTEDTDPLREKPSNLFAPAEKTDLALSTTLPPKTVKADIGRIFGNSGILGNALLQEGP